MKRLIKTIAGLALVASLAVGITACGGSDAASTKPTPPNKTATMPTSPRAERAEQQAAAKAKLDDALAKMDELDKQGWTVESIQRDIKRDLTNQLNKMPESEGLTPITVPDLTCIKKDDSTAKCFAKARSSVDHSTLRMHITVDIDPQGGYVWTVDQ
jgi:hypothetical protein